jgi:hypothetical protein
MLLFANAEDPYGPHLPDQGIFGRCCVILCGIVMVAYV